MNNNSTLKCNCKNTRFQMNYDDYFKDMFESLSDYRRLYS